MQHSIVAYDKNTWCAVPANNGASGPYWQWGNEVLIGFTRGQAQFSVSGHQVDDTRPQQSWLARSYDGGATWITWKPEHYQGDIGCLADDAVPPDQPVRLDATGLVIRVEGHGYHANQGRHWFYSLNKGLSWHGPFCFAGLKQPEEVAGRQFTARTAYLINSASDALFFLSVRDAGTGRHEISTTEKVFLAQTTDGGLSFRFVSWIVPLSNPCRATMAAPVRLTDQILAVAIRRRSGDQCWIDCFTSQDNGLTWSFQAKVSDTGGSNGNPPAMIRLTDGRLCCVFGQRDRKVIMAKYSQDGGQTWSSDQVLRADFCSRNGWPDLGYPRLFQRPDRKLLAVYFWCSPERPETHIAATIFDPSDYSG